MFAREGMQLLAQADNCLTFRALLYLDPLRSGTQAVVAPSICVAIRF